MEIRLVGTGSIGAVQSSASTLVNKKILIDMPNGIVKRLKQFGENVLNIDIVLITHLHGDHYFDIPFFILEKYFYKIKEKTTIYGPKDTARKVKKLFELAFPGEYKKVMENINIEFKEFKNLENQKLKDNIYVESVLVDHGKCKPAYGYLLKENSRNVGFSGDSKMCEAIDYIVQNSIVSVLDMSFAENINHAHMGLHEIERICDKYKEKIIITTHMQDYTRNEAKNKNIKNLIVPDDGQIINI